MLADRLHRLESVGALGHNIDVRHCFEVLAQQVTRELFVIDDRGTHPRPLRLAGLPGPFHPAQIQSHLARRLIAFVEIPLM